MNRFPTLSQWKQIFKVLRKGEKVSLLVFFLVGFSSFIFLVSSIYFSSTKVVPTLGGTYVEGVIGQPRFINPIYGETNDIDRALIDLVFSGLMTYDKQGSIVTDLAQTYKVSPDGKTYDVTLKNNIFWHDGKPLTADDIIFTVKTIQNSDYKSPLRANWIDVQAQKVSDISVRFTLKSPYNSFLETLTVKIIPKHIWEIILPENFIVSPYNFQPVGSGPFQFQSLNQSTSGFINTLTLASYRRYYRQPSYLSVISFKFFEKKEDLVKAANAGQINGFTLAGFDNNQALAQKEIKQNRLADQKFSNYSFSLPRYFAVFLNNQKASIFSDANIRKAFSYATDKNDLVKKISEDTQSSINKIDSPVLPEFFGYSAPTNTYAFDQEQAKNLLDKAGFKLNASGQREKAVTKTPSFQFKSYLKVGSKSSEVTQLQQCLAKLNESFKTILANETQGTYGKATEEAVTEFQKKYLPDLKPTGETGTSTRTKLNQLCLAPSNNSQALAFTITTTNQPQLIAAANLLKNYSTSVGAQVTINQVSVTEIKQLIKTRSYDALLYGEALGAEADLYPFWHSSQKVDPGLNLSSYENKTADQLLKEARETTDMAIKKQKLEKLQDIIIGDAPAIFLYNPDYIYWVSNKVAGIDAGKIIDPAKRFIDISNWFIKTKRTWK